MSKLIAFSCLLAGSACLGVGGMLLLSGLLLLEGIFCILLGFYWLMLSELTFTQRSIVHPKGWFTLFIHKILSI